MVHLFLIGSPAVETKPQRAEVIRKAILGTAVHSGTVNVCHMSILARKIKSVYSVLTNYGLELKRSDI